jgi:amino acid adenylation domain-containing protein
LESFAMHYVVLRDELQALKKRGAFLRDVFLRYPALRRCAETDTTSLFQVAVEHVERLSDYDAMAGSQISLVIPEHGSECLWVYDGEALDEQSVHTIAKQFTALLQAVAADPNRRVADVALLTEKELHKLIVEWNQTSIEYPKDRCVHELIEAHARRAPDDIAVVFDKQRLTYYELNRKANQLAHHLRKLGVKPETLVAICVERSIEMVIGLLGILKAGGAYVPLDPSYPKERIALMLEDSQAPVLLTRQSLIEKLPAHAGRILCLDRDWKPFTEEPADDLQSGVGTDRLAYVIYTSGSTGKPKGVAITHDSLLNLVFWHERAYKITSKDRATQIASMGFDACVWELWPYLTAGASIYLPDEVTRLTPIKLRDWLIANEITLCFLPTPLAESIQDLDWPEGGALRYLLTGGDQLRQYPKSTLGFQVVNHYGPTESTVVASCAIADPKYSSERLPSIGRPIANTQIYLLDKHLNPVPLGVPGELYIGGAGLARGYLNRPDLTQEKFVSNPFSREPQARLYRTGDLARYYSDGNLEFLGRSDHQVKIRGFRIELGDIEAALTEHAAVEKCVVIAREDAPGEKRLAAYVVPNREQSPSNDELRSFLKEKLPEHMLPSAYVTLDEIPLTPNGKIDRRALPAPDLSRQQVRNAFVKHRDTIELQLRHIWEQLLRIQPIGVKDDFFELGGHSLLAVRMFNRIEEVFGRVLPLATLLQAPTIEKLAEHLRDEDRSAHWSSLVAIQPEGARPPLFCIHAGGGNVLFYRDLARHLGPDQPFYALQPQGLDRKRPRHTRVEEMAAHYINEIRTLQVEGPYYLGGACFGGLVALEMAQQLHAQGQEVALLAMFDTNGPGYPKPLPSTRLLRLTRFYSFVRRAEHHWGSLLKMGANDKWEYFLKKTDKARRLLRRNIKNGKKGIARKFYETTGRIIPPGLDKPLYYLLEAQKAYVPKEYPGRITLFRAGKQPLGIYHDPAMGWSGLALGGLQIIEAPGYHAGMLSEPRVQALSEMVKTCLAEAQAGENRAEAFAYSAAS